MGRDLTYYLAENPWYLVAIAGIIAAVFLLALKATQDGRYLVRALVALGVAGVLVLVDLLWVTDAERVAQVVRDLGAAVERSDGPAVLALMDEHVTFSMRSNTYGEELMLDSFAELLRQVRFDFVRVRRLTTSAGAQTHRGQAEFKVMAAGTIDLGGAHPNFAGNSEWSLGFRKVGDAWKINRITAVELPQYTMLPTIKVRIPATASQPATAEPLSRPAPVPPPHGGFGRRRGGAIRSSAETPPRRD